MLNNTPHAPVLLQQIVDCFFNTKGTLIDCTLGYGGHSKALLEHNNNLSIIGIDQDQTALDFSLNRLNIFKNRFSSLKGRFSKQLQNLYNNNITINAILADIGVSSLQLDQSNRGFRFDSDELDMRMNQESGQTAKDIVNSYSQKQLECIFRDYGEIKPWRKVTQAILNAREIKPIQSAKELSAIVNSFGDSKKIHPATLIFQAIRIEVNNELDELKQLLDVCRKNATTGTLIGIISFHSLEDRIVKQAFKKWSKNCICSDMAMRCECGNNNAKGKIITKKPIVANNIEIKVNPRSRSAKLRIFRFD